MSSLPGEVFGRLADSVQHRGPDGGGGVFLGRIGNSWSESDPNPSVWLGHRRLSILDLSDSGRQPMRYRDSWLVFNGEIYNYLELKRELASRGHGFRTRTDSEVLLAAYEEWGVEAFARLRGMWGFAIFDGRSGELVISRDRLGIKPLYYAHFDGMLAVVSEIKQLLALPSFRPGARSEAITTYLATGWEDSTHTFFDGVTPLRPGTWARVDATSLAVHPHPYWFPERIAVEVRDPAEAGTRVAAALAESVRLHLRSDVPVGCALSGGLDSSAVAVLANEARAEAGAVEPFHTFSISFPGEPIDERPFIDEVNHVIDASPTIETPTASGFLADLEDFVWHHDEPVGSLSMYAGYCLARRTREAGVPVSLNGQGGDESLGGYWQSYFAYLLGLGRHGDLVTLARHLGGALLPGGNPQLWLQAPALLGRWRRKSRPFLEVRGGPAGPGSTSAERVLGMSPRERRLHEIRELFLPRLLRWDDRNTMAFSVEGRYPFLDHVFLETALAVDPSALFSGGWTKMPLRRGMVSKLPEAIRLRRSKLGFETPQARWLRGPLLPRFESLVAGDSPAWAWVERDSVRRALDELKRGSATAARGEELFRVLMVDRWSRQFLERGRHGR
ncbi:MAG: asparagine synthase (glutamine-hydrolyzing) [Holophagales bacterium]|nr:MAG: asparagine synthase (glutamine-hydrolyzing) [Holophagales bacterium]